MPTRLRHHLISPFGNRLSFTMSSLCCILAAQKKAKYRDSLITGRCALFPTPPDFPPPATGVLPQRVLLAHFICLSRGTLVARPLYSRPFPKRFPGESG